MTAPRITPEEQRLIDSILSELQTGGATGGAEVDRDFLIQDGYIDAFMLYYFADDFVSWEPLNELFFDFLENKREGQARCPAGHGKSTMILDWFAYVFCREPNISCIYTEKALPVAQGRCVALQDKLRKPRLVEHYGEFKGPRWSTQNFTIAQRTRSIDVPTFRVYGAGGGSVLGQRCNIEINDDPVTDENNASEKERDNLYRWFTKAAATAPYPLPIANKRYLKKHFLVGTVFGPDDLYHRVYKAKSSDPDYGYLHLKAVNESTGATLSTRFCYVEPEELSRRAADDAYYADLEGRVKRGEIMNLYAFRREHGSFAFYQRYQNEAIDLEHQKFPRAWFLGESDDMAPPGGYPGCVDNTLELGQKLPGYIYVTGVDPASGSQSEYAVRFACVTLGWNPDDPKSVHLADLDYGRYPLVSDNESRQTQAKIVLDHVKRFDSRVVVEVNNIQGVYRDVFQQEAAKQGLSLRMTAHYTSKRKKINFEEGVEAMQPMVENGHLRIPYKNPSDVRKVSELIDEMSLLGAHGTDDIVMALWFAWRVIERNRGRRTSPYVPREIPEYMIRGDELIFPPHWDTKRRLAYMGLAPSEESDEEEDAA